MNYLRKKIKTILLKSNLFSKSLLNRRRKHWVRVICDESTENLIWKINPERLNVLEVSGNRWKNKFNYKNYTSLSYPNFNIQNIDNYNKTYDLIILEHVAEHLEKPNIAIKNVYQLLNPNGYVLIVTPFLIKIHNAPIDCTRWTLLGLKHLLKLSGFKSNKIQGGQWGNRACIKANFKKWIKYNPIYHSLKNESNFPVIVWCLAQK